MIVGMLVLIVGLIYVAQGTQATNYDYELSQLEDEISELEAKKEDLAVEKARLTSVAASENSTVECDGYGECKWICRVTTDSIPCGSYLKFSTSADFCQDMV